MVRGVGTDIVEIDRIRKVLDRLGSRFERRVFTAQEIDYCRSRRDAAVHFAGRFAAKEAVMKALTTGWGRGVGWRDIEVVSLEGPPTAKLTGRAGEVARIGRGGRVHLSISHSDSHAVAVAVVEDDWTGPGNSND